MGSGADSSVYIRTPAQWRAVSSPVRVEMLEALRRLGPLSLKQIAQRLDRPADGLYHHARLLLSAGIIHTVRRSAGPRSEAVYALAGSRIEVDLSTDRPAPRSPLLRMLSSLHRASQRSLVAAYKAGKLAKPPQNWNYRWEVGWLNRAGYLRVQKHLDAIIRILDDGRADNHGALYHFQMLTCPVARRRGADARRNHGRYRKP